MHREGILPTACIHAQREGILPAGNITGRGRGSSQQLVSIHRGDPPNIRPHPCTEGKDPLNSQHPCTKEWNQSSTTTSHHPHGVTNVWWSEYSTCRFLFQEKRSFKPHPMSNTIAILRV
ncbi:hypothetical protein J4Q44_G00269100 [Coregonus suidteri]|uniref:Uncharacterized protein n=1 Tax=Coregonus suidteri TaxID=861788 RepID=A0AAN8QFD8_9TELE